MSEQEPSPPSEEPSPPSEIVPQADGGDVDDDSAITTTTGFAKVLPPATWKTPNPGVVTDVVTRWWATHDMIERLIYLKPAIDLMAANEQLGGHGLSNHNWVHLADMLKVMEPFKDAQLMLEGDKYVTSSIVLPAVGHVRKRLTTLSNQAGDSPSKTLATEMLDDFETRWGKANEPVLLAMFSVVRGTARLVFIQLSALLLSLILGSRGCSGLIREAGMQSRIMLSF